MQQILRTDSRVSEEASARGGGGRAPRGRSRGSERSRCKSAGAADSRCRDLRASAAQHDVHRAPGQIRNGPWAARQGAVEARVTRRALAHAASARVGRGHAGRPRRKRPGRSASWNRDFNLFRPLSMSTTTVLPTPPTSLAEIAGDFNKMGRSDFGKCRFDMASIAPVRSFS